MRTHDHIPLQIATEGNRLYLFFGKIRCIYPFIFSLSRISSGLPRYVRSSCAPSTKESIYFFRFRRYLAGNDDTFGIATRHQPRNPFIFFAFADILRANSVASIELRAINQVIHLFFSLSRIFSGLPRYVRSSCAPSTKEYVCCIHIVNCQRHEVMGIDTDFYRYAVLVLLMIALSTIIIRMFSRRMKLNWIGELLIWIF